MKQRDKVLAYNFRTMNWIPTNGIPPEMDRQESFSDLGSTQQPGNMLAIEKDTSPDKVVLKMVGGLNSI